MHRARCILVGIVASIAIGAPLITDADQQQQDATRFLEATGKTKILHGAWVSCATTESLDRALATNDQHFFDGWSEHDYEVAIWWANCPPAKPRLFQKNPVPQRVALLQTQIDLFHQNQSQQSRQRAAAEQTAYTLSLCRKTAKAALFAVQEKIIFDNQRLAAVNADLIRQKRIAGVSGAVDLAAEHRDGEQIVDLEDELSSSWRTYKNLGGRADTLQTVTHEIADPCM